MVGIDKLKQGYQQFYKKYFEKDNTLYKSLSEGQSPKTLVVACADSRVDPSFLMNTKPGDIFVIRNVANIVPPYQQEDTTYHGTSAALEFAVKGLNVENIVILGHSGCGGIDYLIRDNGQNDGSFSFLKPWVRIVADAKNKILRENPSIDLLKHPHLCEKEAIKISMNNLMTFPYIKERVDSEKLNLQGWYFCIQTGKVDFLEFA